MVYAKAEPVRIAIDRSKVVHVEVHWYGSDAPLRSHPSDKHPASSDQSSAIGSVSDQDFIPPTDRRARGDGRYSSESEAAMIGDCFESETSLSMSVPNSLSLSLWILSTVCASVFSLFPLTLSKEEERERRAENYQYDVFIVTVSFRECLSKPPTSIIMENFQLYPIRIS